MLQSHSVALDTVIELDADAEVVVDRLLKRAETEGRERRHRGRSSATG